MNDDSRATISDHALNAWADEVLRREGVRAPRRAAPPWRGFLAVDPDDRVAVNQLSDDEAGDVADAEEAQRGLWARELGLRPDEIDLGTLDRVARALAPMHEAADRAEVA